MAKTRQADGGTVRMGDTLVGWLVGVGLAGGGGDGATSHVTVREGRQRGNQVGFTWSRDQKRE